MDIQREGAARRRLIRPITYGSIALAVVPLLTIGVSRLKPAAPSLERPTVWTDTVKRGPMLRQVRGLGTLVPEQLLWIPAATDGRIERILVQPGDVVKADTILLVLSNPELELAALDAEYQVKAAEAQYADLRAQVEKLRALARLKRSQVEALRVRAGTEGVLQQLSPVAQRGSDARAVEVGQRVTAGTILAKVAQPHRLKAELKIPETQAKDVQVGQKGEIDTRNGIIAGRVTRVDPAVREGTVTVDVKLEGLLPQDARPDLSVDGVIELERLEDVVYVGRPAFGQQNSMVSMFKLDSDGKGASRVQVRLGRSSVNTIEVLEGLLPGDQVILSDMSAWDAHDRIRLN